MQVFLITQLHYNLSEDIQQPCMTVTNVAM